MEKNKKKKKKKRKERADKFMGMWARKADAWS